MSLLSLFRRDPLRSLAEFEADAALRRKQEAERELNRTGDLAQPDLSLSRPRLMSGDHAYILLPDAENNAGDKVVAARQVTRFEELVAKLNRNQAAKDAPSWPESPTRREVRSAQERR